jgi:hypothetical protein
MDLHTKLFFRRAGLLGAHFNRRLGWWISLYEVLEEFISDAGDIKLVFKTADQIQYYNFLLVNKNLQK